MKLLIVHNKYKSNNIGGEDVVYSNEVTLLTKKLGAENVFSYEVSNDNISKLKIIYSLWFSYKHYSNIKKIVQDNNIDLVHVHNFYPLLTPSVFKAAKKLHVKVVHTLHNYRLWCIAGILYRDGYGVCELCVNKKFALHGIINKCYRKSLYQSIAAQFSFWFYKLSNAFNNIDYFFVLTHFQKEKIKSFGVCESKIIIKPNSVQPILNLCKARHGYIYVGRLEEAKGIYELLEVWRQLDIKFILTIIGVSFENVVFLEQKYKAPNIIFKGKRSSEYTISAIARAKYLIQPSVLYETFGLTIIEAMAHGVPVIGFNIGTRAEFIENGVNGFLCDRNSLKDTIEKSFNFSEYEALSKNSFLKAKEFDSEYITCKQIQIYQDILKT